MGKKAITKSKASDSAKYEYATEKTRQIIQKNIKLLRISKDMKQTDCAFMSGTSQRWWSGMETQENTLSLQSIVIVAMTLNVDIRDLFDPLLEHKMRDKGVTDRRVY